jgi:hypothetical protein
MAYATRPPGVACVAGGVSAPSVTSEVNGMSEHSTSTTAPAADRDANGVAHGATNPAEHGAAKTDTGPIAVPQAGEPAVAPVAEPVPSAPGAGGVTDSSRGIAIAPDEPPPHPTTPVAVRVRGRGGRRPAPRQGPLTRMGPWAPVAGAAFGLVAGVVVVLLLAGVAVDFADRLALVLTVVGLTMLGASGTLLADEVRMIRNSTRAATARPAWVEVTTPLLTGLTPARLLLMSSGFVLFLAAFVSR